MTSPYRQRPRVLFCPRCNVLLDMFDPGVEVCPRCEGVWLARSVLDVSGARWPAGPQVWWRNELECPDCLVDGTRTRMGARTSGELIVDQCPAHGVWLDRGELARIMTDPGAHGAQALRDRFSAVAPTPEQLVVRRERWRAEQEQRRLAAELERQRLEDELAHRAAAEDAARH
nr:zf-TFIIB domain-containing protein [Deltaproteobacteria bacterium]